MVIDISRDPEPVMIGMMIMAPELEVGEFSGICGGVAMTSGEFPGEGGTLRAGRGTDLVATVVSFRPLGAISAKVVTLGMIPRKTRIT